MGKTASQLSRHPWRWGLAVVGVSVLAFSSLLSFNATRVNPRPPPFERMTSLAVDADRAASALSDYVRIDTSTPSGITANVAAATVSLLRERYLTPMALEHRVLDDRMLLIRWKGDDAQAAPLLLLTHADVVPVAEDERAGWTHGPFDGDVADGFVWGRGAIDNKASTVCVLEAIASLQKAGKRPRRDVLLLVVPDEEIGGEQGAGRFVRDHLATFGRPDLVIDEGTYVVTDIIPGVRVAPIAVGEKRYVTLRLRVQGEAGHASMPTRDNAPRVLAAGLGRLDALEFEAHMLPPVEAFLEGVSDAMPFDKRLAIKNLWLFGSMIEEQLSRKPASNAILRDTWALTVLRGGVKDNVVPAVAEAYLNLRLLPTTKPEQSIDHIRAVLADPRIEIEVVTDWGPAPMAPFRGPDWNRLASSVAAGIPDVVVVPALTPGTMDARWFAQAGIPSYRFQPYTLDAGERQRIHGVDERISIENLRQAITAYAHMMRYL